MFKSILTVLITLMFSFAPFAAHAAGETGHSDLMRLLASLYGLNMNAADYLATVNQSVDKVPLSAATQSGRASAKLHFGSVVTATDLAEKDFATILANKGNRSFGQVISIFLKNNAMGGGVAALGNAESAEALSKAIRTGDGLLYGMGLHYLLDVSAPFHDGFMGALSNPIPGLNKIPFLHQFAFGHLAEGTSPDKLTVGKIVLAMDAMGPFLITLRESQKDSVGVNSEWLNRLRSQGVDVNDSESIRNWFMRQDVVKTTLESSLPANRSVDFAQVITQELKEELMRVRFFNSEQYLDSQLAELVDKAKTLEAAADTGTSMNDLITQLIDKAWNDGQLNESRVISETTTDYFGLFEPTEKLSDLIYDPRFEGLPGYAQDAIASQLAAKSTHIQHSRGWLLDQIRAKITRGMLSQSWEKFNTSYLNDNTENAQIRIEQEAIGKIEKHFFNRNGKYSYNASADHWAQVFKTWREMPKQDRGSNILEKIITFCDLVIKTKAYEGKEIHTLNFALKAQMFIKTMQFIFKEEILNPLTTRGNFAVRIRAFRDRIIRQIQQEFPEGLLTARMLEKADAYNKFINRKFNSDDAVGFRQRAARVVRSGAEVVRDLVKPKPSPQPAGARVSCRAIVGG